jgi:hypothetical protein
MKLFWETKKIDNAPLSCSECVQHQVPATNYKWWQLSDWYLAEDLQSLFGASGLCGYFVRGQRWMSAGTA